MRRAAKLALLLLAALVSAGCATEAPAPAVEPDAPEKPQPELIFSLKRTFDGTQGEVLERFTLAKGHWLCVEAVLEGEGDLGLAVDPPELDPWVILERGGNRTASEMVPGMVGEYVVRIDATGFVGTLDLVITNDP